ncbi:MAG: putative Ig domain-containing protein [gamma proteobacterium endosymbiont of Lamellibrachia anaximandri]|nr:putative Ig domain-containing protein [gamma proteobacterium endosymbiont of Lamellibrachia anaximandri]
MKGFSGFRKTIFLLTALNCIYVLPAFGELSMGLVTATSVQRVNRFEVIYTYTAVLNNSGPEPLSNVTATLTSNTPYLTIIDGEIVFPDVPVSDGIESTDTITIRYNRRHTFRDEDHDWSFSQEDPAPSNTVPVADAGSDQSAFLWSTVTLNGSGSSDVDGDLLTFTWSLLSAPGGSAAALSDPNAVMPDFVLDAVGIYELELVVNDGTDDSVPDRVLITTSNSPPVADAGLDQSILTGTTVSLDGSGSSDVDGDLLTFTWSLPGVPAGSVAALSDPNAVMPSFIADLPGSYLAELIVNDGFVDSAIDIVTVTTENSGPVADAGPDQTVAVGDLVTLQGNGSSDADGDALSYLWSLIAVPTTSSASLSDPAAVSPAFIPDVPGDYLGQLIVNDGVTDSAPDTVKISTINSAPVADAGPDQTSSVGGVVTLDGSGSSDVDGDVLTYSWAFTSKPAGSSASLSDPGALSPAFVIDLPGTYVVGLVVNDGTLDSDSDPVIIQTENQAPVAVAVADADSVTLGTQVNLDGTASSDPDGDPLGYAWTLTTPTESTAILSDATSPTPGFTPDVAGNYLATLVVSDGTLASVAQVAVSASIPNNPPTLVAVGNRTISASQNFSLRLFGIDTDIGDTLTYSLSVSPSAMSVNPATGDLNWTPGAGDLGANVVMAQVNDNAGLSDAKSFTIDVVAPVVPPPANEPPQLAPIVDQTVTVGNALAVTPTANDPDVGDSLTLSLPLAPAGLTLAAGGTLQWTPTVDQVGSHDVTVQVTDGSGVVAVQSFIVTVIAVNRAPVAVDDTYTARVGETLAVAAPGILENDMDLDGDVLTSALVTDASKGTLNLNPDGSFDYTPTPPEFVFDFGTQIRCQLPENERRSTETVPIIMDLDGDGQSELIFTGSYATGGASRQHITAMRPDCSILWSFESAGFGTPIPNLGTTSNPRHPMAAADMDGDGNIEILVPIRTTGILSDHRYLILDHEGTLIGQTDLIPQINSQTAFQHTAPAIADLDADGDAEIVVAFIQANLPYLAIFDHNGNLLVVNEDAPSTANTSNSAGTKPVIVDLDLDGIPEILMTSHVYSNTGVYLRTFPLNESLGAATVHSNPRAIPAVANFDSDPEPEIYFQTNRGIYLFDQDGSLIWFFNDDARKNVVSNSGFDIPVTLANVDADSEIEIVTYIGRHYLTVLEADGSIKWQHTDAEWIFDDVAGPTAFDIDGNGIAEVIHVNGVEGHNGGSNGLYIHDGETGAELNFTRLNQGGSHLNSLLIADMDDDGESEIIVNNAFSTNAVWAGNIAVLEGLSGYPWAASRGIRNQLIDTYTHIEDDGGVPVSVKPHWLQLGKNGFNFVPQSTKVYTQIQCESPLATQLQHNATIAVGDVDNDGDIELAGVAFFGTTLQGTEVWLMNADDCSQQLLPNAADIRNAGGMSTGSQLGLHDIDGDGDLEIIGVRRIIPGVGSGGGEQLLAVHHDGSLVWPGDGASEPLGLVSSIGNSSDGGFAQMGPTFADIDGNGSVEIIMSWYTGAFGAAAPGNGVTVYNVADGTILWEYLGTTIAGDTDYKPPTVVDLDLDGTLEIIFHKEVLDHLGNKEFDLPIISLPESHLSVAVANFDEDPFPEIVGRDQGHLYLFEHDGTTVFANPNNNNSQSQISVADFDGDGEVEFAWYNGLGGFLTSGYMEVYDTDGSLLWSHQGLKEFGEDITRLKGVNPTAFDANGDGAFDIVVHLDIPNPIFGEDDGVYIFDGRDGSLLEYMPIGSASREQRYTTITDIDGDGAAEIISSFSNGLAGATRIWEGTASQPLPDAPAHRNQWTFNEGYADAKGNTLSNPVPHWLQSGLNGWNLIKLPPDPLAGTTDSFTYTANDGQVNSNTATVTFDVQPPGTPPVFLSAPDTLTTVGFSYEYAPRVVDIDPGDSVSFILTGGPAGMTIDPGNGRVSFTPDSEGSYKVSILASDTIGFSTPQTYTLTVGLPVTVPSVISQSQAIAETSLGGVGLLTGDVLSLNHPVIPAGDVSNQTPVAGSVAEFGSAVDLIISLGPAPEDIDNDGDGFTENQGDCNDTDNTIHTGANDPSADGIDQDCDGIDGNLSLTSILMLPATGDILTGDVVSLSATGIFEGGTSQNLTEIVNWSAGPVFSSATAGVFNVSATRGPVSGSAIINVVERVTGDVAPPVAEITVPAAGSTVTEPVDIVGTATDANFLKYTIGIAPTGETDFTEIANSTSQVTDGVLGQFDPTVLINDLYTIRLTVFDQGGNVSIHESTIQVDENLKVGNFSLSFTDLHIPMSGIPIKVVRNYDSRDKRKGDFGVGWRLDVQTLRLRSNRVLGSAWQVAKSGFTYVLLPTDDHKVSLVLANGQVEEFDLLVNPIVSALIPFPPSAIRASYIARPGTLGRLESLDNNNLTILDGQPGDVGLRDDLTNQLYDPDLFRYTSADGTQIVISKADGVQSIRDANGNTLTFTPNGITHSSGKSIIFVRDDLGRIAQITDPNGNSQTYTYDANGDLTHHTDTESNTTTYAYDAHHGLINLFDPLDRSLLRNEYGPDGRLISTTNADGRIVTLTHNVGARQEIVTDIDGSMTVMEYDASGNVLSVTDPLGSVTSHTYDGSGNPLTTTNGEGETTTRTYDARSNKLTETDPLGNTTTFIYDSADRVTRKTDARGNSTDFSYDARGNLLTHTNALGLVELSNSYDTRGNLLVQTDALGNTTQYEYDAVDNQIARTDALGNRTTYTYDANGNQLTETDRLGKTTTQLLDGRGLAIRSTDPLGNTTEFQYTVTGLLQAITDPAGNTTHQVLNAEGRELSSTDALGNLTENSYDIKGNLTRTTDPLGRIRTLQYDDLDRQIGATEPDGNASVLMYDNAGRIVEQIDARGNSTRFVYDFAGRNIKVIDALLQETRFEYDSVGNRIGMVDAKGQIFSFSYDALDRRVQVNFPDGSFETTAYDAADRVIRETDALGRSTHYQYDAKGNLTGVTDVLGGQTSYLYDQEDNLLAQTDARGNTTRFIYDDADRQTRKTYPDGTTETRQYDPVGNVTTTTDANSDITVQSFDAKGQLIAKTFPDATGETFSYTATGKVATADNVQGTTTYSYDVNDRLVRLGNSDGSSIEYGYDAEGNRTSVASRLMPMALARTTNYTYDVLNRIATVIDPDSNTTTYAYDAVGNLASIDYPNGVVTTYTYDSLSRLSLQVHSKAGVELERFHYVVNAIGDRTRVTQTDGSFVEYEYDGLRRLIRETHRNIFNTLIFDRNYIYDEVGNRTSTIDLGGTTIVYLYDSADKLLSAGSTSYAYDPNGNRSSRVDGGGLTTYDFDFENKLTSVNASSGAVTYGYNAQGNRTQRTESAVTTHFLVDPINPTGVSQVLGDYDSAANPIAEYFYGNQMLAQSRSGVTHYLHRDARQNVRLLTDSAGNLTDTYQYQAFGQELSQFGSTTNPYRYSGERVDPTTGLVHMRARDYDPATGRFVGRDPFEGVLRDPVSLHRYLYANANPVFFSDPTGRFSAVELSVSVSIGEILFNLGPTLIKGTFTAMIIKKFFGIGFHLRQAGYELMLGQYNGPHKFEVGTSGYHVFLAGNAFIKMGAIAIDFVDTLTDALFSITAASKSLVGVAGAVRAGSGAVSVASNGAQLGLDLFALTKKIDSVSGSVKNLHAAATGKSAGKDPNTTKAAAQLDTERTKAVSFELLKFVVGAFSKGK